MRRFLLVLNLLTILALAVTVIAAFGFGWMPIQVVAAPPPLPATNSQSKLAVFNMAVIMKDFKKAKNLAFKLNEERSVMSADLVQKRGHGVKLQQQIQNEQNTVKKDELMERHKELQREIEDLDRKINKQLNEKASEIIALLYDDIKETVDRIAEAKGLEIVFSYPDATDSEQLKSSYIKELKLKPPAAQPFAVNKRVDITDEILKELNTRHPAPSVPEGTQFPPMPMTGK